MCWLQMCLQSDPLALIVSHELSVSDRKPLLPPDLAATRRAAIYGPSSPTGIAALCLADSPWICRSTNAVSTPGHLDKLETFPLPAKSILCMSEIGTREAATSARSSTLRLVATHPDGYIRWKRAESMIPSENKLSHREPALFAFAGDLHSPDKKTLSLGWRGSSFDRSSRVQFIPSPQKCRRSRGFTSVQRTPRRAATFQATSSPRARGSGGWRASSSHRSKDTRAGRPSRSDRGPRGRSLTLHARITDIVYNMLPYRKYSASTYNSTQPRYISASNSIRHRRAQKLATPQRERDIQREIARSFSRSEGRNPRENGEEKSRTML